MALPERAQPTRAPEAQPTVVLSVVTDPEPTLVLPVPLRPDATPATAGAPAARAASDRRRWWRFGSAAWGWLTAADPAD